MEPILASTSVGISELKANPSAVLESSADMPVAILNRNKPVGYLMSAKAWEAICDQLEDVELCRIADERLNGSASGKLMLRIRPEVHAAAAIAARASGKSMNQWANEVLERAAGNL